MNSEALLFFLSVEKKVHTVDKDETVSNTFEVLKFFFSHLRKVGRIYPDVIISKEKTGGKKIRIEKNQIQIF